jgi:hypothetical protein
MHEISFMGHEHECPSSNHHDTFHSRFEPGNAKNALP